MQQPISPWAAKLIMSIDDAELEALDRTGNKPENFHSVSDTVEGTIAHFVSRGARVERRKKPTQ